jgi:hypothetical protein
MGYEQKIMPADGGYKGYLLNNGEVIAVTVWCKTLAEASVRTRRLQEETGATIVSKPTTQTQSSTTLPSTDSVTLEQLSPNINITKKPNTRCCGRR